MLADDDDVWRPDKIAVTLAEMRRLEAVVGEETPVLVHTDLAVVDRQLRTVSASLARSQRLAAHETRLARLLVQNSVTGCTVMVNRALANLVGEPFDGIAMHDWWLALIASAFGHLAFVDVPTVQYRQHGHNTVGAVDARDMDYVLARAVDRDGTRTRMRMATQQAGAFLDHFGDRLTPVQRRATTALAHLDESGKLGRLLDLNRHGLWKNTLLRRLGQVWFV